MRGTIYSFDDIVVGVAHSHLGRSATSLSMTSHLHIDPKHRTLRHHSIAAVALLMHPTARVHAHVHSVATRPQLFVNFIRGTYLNCLYVATPLYWRFTSQPAVMVVVEGRDEEEKEEEPAPTSTTLLDRERGCGVLENKGDTNVFEYVILLK